MTVHRDLAYGRASPTQLVDLYVPDGDPPASGFPLVVAIHGGAFLVGNRSWELDALPALTAAGFAVASVEYRLSGEAVFPAAVVDVLDAIAFLRQGAAGWSLDPERFVAWGRSAGGYLAAMAGVLGGRVTDLRDDGSGLSVVSAVIDWYGPSDFLVMDQQFRDVPPSDGSEPQIHDDPSSPESMFLGAPIQSVPALAHRSSPLSYLQPGAQYPPFFLAAGDADHLVPCGQTVLLAEALTRAGVDVTMTILPGAPHAGPRFEQELTQPAIDWIRALWG